MGGVRIRVEGDRFGGIPKTIIVLLIISALKVAHGGLGAWLWVVDVQPAHTLLEFGE